MYDANIVYVHFTFESRTYVQTDGVAMGSPLEPVLAEIFMIELENIDQIYNIFEWYKDDPICFVKIGTTALIISVLNSFDKNIQFTFEDIWIRRKRNDITTTVYQKSTCNDIYLDWNAFAPAAWKRGTLKTLAERAYVICSTDQLLERESKYLEKVFH